MIAAIYARKLTEQTGVSKEEEQAMNVALYARYLSKNQKESSITDQFRNCEERATREGWPVTARYKDEAISGSTTERPGYQVNSIVHRLIMQGRYSTVSSTVQINRICGDKIKCRGEIDHKLGRSQQNNWVSRLQDCTDGV